MLPIAIPLLLAAGLSPRIEPTAATSSGEVRPYPLAVRSDVGAEVGAATQEEASSTGAVPEGATARRAGAFVDWLASGEAYLNFRWRLEVVDIDGFSEEAIALTLRTVLGYRTKEVAGFSGLIEVEDVSSTGVSENDSIVDGTRLIGDPPGTEVNQAYVDYEGVDGLLARVGRQIIVLDNARWIADARWRQNYQTYDAVTAKFGGVENVTLQYTYFSNVNRGSRTNDLSSSHLFNASYSFSELGKAVAYLYHLDFDDQPDSTATFGMRLSGERSVADGLRIGYEGEYAHQVDVADNPNDVDADYYHLAFGARQGPVGARLGFEVLGGSTEVGNLNRVTTPLARRHKFNGWADRFLTTPATGLEDLYIALEAHLADRTSLSAIYHDFAAEAGGDRYGNEIDLLLTHECSERVRIGLKAASYHADDFSEDTLKAWVWLQVSL